jgi:hypothetical protein
MPSPFPGMNPYLEHPELWPEVHHWLITLTAEALVAQLRPKYRVAVEKRVYQTTSGEESLLVGVPDVLVARSSPSVPLQSATTVVTPPVRPVTVTLPIPEEVREGYLEVREVGTGEVVTVIEFLSPKNKRSQAGRKAYESKRQQILASASHLVEIDLLRSGEPMPILSSGIQSDYRILVSRSSDRPRAELYAFNLQTPIPVFPLPLRPPDIEPVVDLQAVLQGAYDRAGWDLAIDYSREPVPPLLEPDAAWARALLQEQGLGNE